MALFPKLIWEKLFDCLWFLVAPMGGIIDEIDTFMILEESPECRCFEYNLVTGTKMVVIKRFSKCCFLPDVTLVILEQFTVI